MGRYGRTSCTRTFPGAFQEPSRNLLLLLRHDDAETEPAEMCTVMPLSLHHVADEVVTLDVDFNLELTFGDVIPSRVFPAVNSVSSHPLSCEQAT